MNSVEHFNQAQVSIEAATRRRAEYVAAIPAALDAREDTFAKTLCAENASARSKLRKVYELTDEFAKIAQPYTACGKGCSSCCNMNVTISAVEAQAISEVTGIAQKSVSKPLNHALAEFAGVPCPFLDDNACSIYDARPYMCRNHKSFDISSYWCEPSRMNKVEMPKIEFSGLEQAYVQAVKVDRGGVYADIRDFFGTAPLAK